MKKYFLCAIIVIVSINLNAQKTVNNPDYISSNINGKVTKVEITDTETILHFHIKSAIGSWIAIPKQTYIEDSAGKTDRVFIKKTEGVTLTGRNYFTDSDEMRYKLYFPPLSEGVIKINYGESNKGGNWFIYKLDITKDGKQFLKSNDNLNPWKVTIGYPVSVASNKDKVIEIPEHKSGNYVKLGEETLLTKDLPKDFFGNWYDKYGTLLLVATPDYIVLDSRIQYYRNIQKISDTKFIINAGSKSFEILNLEDDKMTIRTNKLITLKNKVSKKNVPNYLKGRWLHWAGVKEITITDEYFFNNDKDYHGTHRDIVKSNIDLIAESNNGDLIWFIIYNRGNYHIYFVNKRDGEFVLQPRGYVNAKYKKVKD